MKAGYFFAGVESQQSQLENLRLGAGLLVDVMYENAKATMKAIVQMDIRTGFALGTEVDSKIPAGENSGTISGELLLKRADLSRCPWRLRSCAGTFTFTFTGLLS